MSCFSSRGSLFSVGFEQEEVKRRKTEGSPGELVKIPDKYKGIVFGVGGDTLKKISTQTGATMIRIEGECYITTGTKSQRDMTKLRIWSIVVSITLCGLQVSRHDQFELTT